MPTEKHGALWADDNSGWTLVFEHYQAEPEMIAAVFSKGARFKAETYKKVADPQWRLPWWSEQRPEALFDNESDAVAHAKALLKR